MLTRVDLTLDCANPQLLPEFWKTGAGYVDEPPPPPFATREDWLAQFDADGVVDAAAFIKGGCEAVTSVEEHENAITYDYPMFSEPMTSEAFIGEF